MLKRMEEYLQARMLPLDWEDLDRLESTVDSIIRPPRGRPRLLENDEASSNETCSLMESDVESITRPQKERPRLLNDDEASRNETSSLLDSMHSRISAPQTAGYPTARREISNPAAHRSRRQKSKSTRPGQRRSDPMAVAHSLGRCPRIP
jgi:hypothetical protein